MVNFSGFRSLLAPLVADARSSFFIPHSALREHTCERYARASMRPGHRLLWVAKTGSMKAWGESGQLPTRCW